MDRKLTQLESTLGYTFDKRALLAQALTHRSASNEHRQSPHNERMEFLGDAVLGMVVSERLYALCPQADEGELSRRRSRLVSTRALAQLARTFDLGELLLLGRGEDSTGGRDKGSLLADATEAVLAAVFLDGGIEAARAVIDRIMGEQIERVGREEAPRDYKSELQERLQQQHGLLPTYQVIDTLGPEHARSFVVEAVAEIDPPLRARGEGSSKKNAEREAAKNLLDLLPQGS